MPEDNLHPPVSGESATDKLNWTVMVYLAGDNNLADECVYALTEMKAANVSDRIKVIAQFDPNGRKVKTRRFVINRPETAAATLGAPSDRPNGANPGAKPKRNSILTDALETLEEGTVKFPGRADYARRGAAVHAGTGAAIAAAVLEAEDDEDVDPDESDTGDPKPLFDFISWSVEHHPADHYMLILGGHGSGVQEEFLRDNSSKGTLSIAELGQVFAAVRSELKTKGGDPLVIDILGMDSCQMSMTEVCYELQGNIKYMVSSESYGPQAGWPYRPILEQLDAEIGSSGDATAEKLASAIVNEYVNFYVEYSGTDGLSVDISMIDVGSIGRLADEIKSLSEVLSEQLRRGALMKEAEGHSDFLDQIVLAHWEAQSYNGETFVDLYDFCDCLQKRYDPAFVPAAPPDDERAVITRDEEVRTRTEVQARCEAVMSVIKNQLVRRSCYMGVTYQYSYGVSIYFPWAEISPDYTRKNLKFIEPSGWRQFLKAYVVNTRRKPRGFRIDRTDFLKFNSNVRKTPLDGRGQENLIINSMRNPPDEVVVGGVSACTRAQEETIDLVKFFTLHS